MVIGDVNKMLYIYTELGCEKRCSACGEYYPLDNEFFYRKGIKNGQVKYTAQCKACHVQNYGA